VLDQLTTSIRRRAVAALDPRQEFGVRDEAARREAADHPVISRQAEIGMLRGVTTAAADVSECTCPGPCERDHANE
jgi:hypothetical protein